MPPQVDGRLRELDFGAFAGLSYEDNLSRHGDRFRAWSADPRSVRPPWGERLGELEARVRAWRGELPTEGCVAVVAHAGPVAVLLADALSASFEDVFALGLRPAEAVQLWIDARGWTSVAFLSPGESGAES